MTTLVTGGTGFLGRHLVERLVARGEQVRVLTRRFDLELSDMGVEIVEGSLLNDEDVARAVDGVTHVYHLAGRVERDPSKAHHMYALHVDATRRLLMALKDQDIQKVVYASTSGTVGVSEDPEDIATERSPTKENLVKQWPYYLSKIYAERTVQTFIDKVMPIVVMRPTLLLGPGDREQSSTGDVVQFLQRKIPSTLEGGLSFVDARDAADAFILAMDKAPAGESYLLGASNVSLEKFFKRLADISGVSAPWMPIPDGALSFGAKLVKRALDAVGATSTIDPVSIEMGRHYWYIDWSKAQRDLGWTPRNGNETLKDTVAWIRAHHPELAPTNTGVLGPEAYVPAVTLEYVRAQRTDEP